MAALQEGQKTWGQDTDFDFSTAVFEALKQVTSHDIGPFAPSSWLCINLDDYRVGRAYPYKGEHRIVPMTPDVELLDAIEQEIATDD